MNVEELSMVAVIQGCALWQCSQQAAPVRLPGECTSDLALQILQAGSIHTEGEHLTYVLHI